MPLSHSLEKLELFRYEQVLATSFNMIKATLTHHSVLLQHCNSRSNEDCHSPTESKISCSKFDDGWSKHPAWSHANRYWRGFLFNPGSLFPTSRLSFQPSKGSSLSFGKFFTLGLSKQMFHLLCFLMASFCRWNAFYSFFEEVERETLQVESSRSKKKLGKREKKRIERERGWKRDY